MKFITVSSITKIVRKSNVIRLELDEIMLEHCTVTASSKRRWRVLKMKLL
jgi:hypothetical protein